MVLLFAPGAYAQKSKESLEKQIKTLQKDIETANKLLKETSKNKEVTLNQVSLMDQKIKNARSSSTPATSRSRCWTRTSTKGRATSRISMES